MSAAGFFFFIAVAALLPSSCHRRRLVAVASSPSSLLSLAAFGRLSHSSCHRSGHLWPMNQVLPVTALATRGR